MKNFEKLELSKFHDVTIQSIESLTGGFMAEDKSKCVSATRNQRIEYRPDGSMYLVVHWEQDVSYDDE
jgi:hypothetical protein